MKIEKHSCRSSFISLRSYPPHYPRTSTPLTPSLPLLLFPPPPLFSLFPVFFPLIFFLFSFPLFLPWTPSLFFLLFGFLLFLFFWRVCWFALVTQALPRLHLSSAADDKKIVNYLHIHLFSNVLHQRRCVSPRRRESSESLSIQIYFCIC